MQRKILKWLGIYSNTINVFLLTIGLVAILMLIITTSQFSKNGYDFSVGNSTNEKEISLDLDIDEKYLLISNNITNNYPYRTPYLEFYFYFSSTSDIDVYLFNEYQIPANYEHLFENYNSNQIEDFMYHKHHGEKDSTFIDYGLLNKSTIFYVYIQRSANNVSIEGECTFISIFHETENANSFYLTIAQYCGIIFDVAFVAVTLNFIRRYNYSTYFHDKVDLELEIQYNKILQKDFVQQNKQKIFEDIKTIYIFADQGLYRHALIQMGAVLETLLTYWFRVVKPDLEGSKFENKLNWLIQHIAEYPEMGFKDKWEIVQRYLKEYRNCVHLKEYYEGNYCLDESTYNNMIGVFEDLIRIF